ncbi:hypothetical protein NDU88_004341 [Pleurodeles waltl]|uniref:Uncharacterized protein n=1 Tax=Pleurodeles waltl TaxID=8319 RepID=A0AAV7QEL3_PLEWA|nr:hypothetical protein NDU88_004341 [Pleurodeles waltl]
MVALRCLDPSLPEKTPTDRCDVQRKQGQTRHPLILPWAMTEVGGMNGEATRGLRKGGGEELKPASTRFPDHFCII